MLRNLNATKSSSSVVPVRSYRYCWTARLCLDKNDGGVLLREQHGGGLLPRRSMEKPASLPMAAVSVWLGNSEDLILDERDSEVAFGLAPRLPVGTASRLDATEGASGSKEWKEGYEIMKVMRSCGAGLLLTMDKKANFAYRSRRSQRAQLEGRYMSYVFR